MQYTFPHGLAGEIKVYISMLKCRLEEALEREVNG